jgi:hypothetical protein
MTPAQLNAIVMAARLNPDLALHIQDTYGFEIGDIIYPFTADMRHRLKKRYIIYAKAGINYWIYPAPPQLE